MRPQSSTGQRLRLLRNQAQVAILVGWPPMTLATPGLAVPAVASP